MFSIKGLKEKLWPDSTQDESNKTKKNKQTLVGALVCFVILVIVIILVSVTGHKSHHYAHKASKKVDADGVISTDFTQKTVVSALEQQQSAMTKLLKRTEKVEKELLREKENKKSLEKKKGKLKGSAKAVNSIYHHRKTGVKSPSSTKAVLPMRANSSTPRHPNVSPAPYGRNLEVVDLSYNDHAKKRVDLSLLQSHPLEHKRTAKNYVPAGTFAKAVLLEGADANASVNGQSNTSGILIRLLDNGTLPNGHHSRLKGCFVLASIYGDISSERGEARLTKISCTRKDGSILEKKVQGYLSFAGKEGIKGEPVMRNGKILAMAGLSGMFSGVGSALKTAAQTQSVSALGTTTTVNSDQIWQSGAYGGAESAMSQLSSYYIKRADQYHPVIEIGSGTVATVIFQSGFSLEDGNDSSPHKKHSKDSLSSSEQIRELLKKAKQASSTHSKLPFASVN